MAVMTLAPRGVLLGRPAAACGAPFAGCSSSSAACPVRARNTSSSDGRRSARPCGATPGAVQRAHRLDERVGTAAADPDADHAGLLVDVRLALADLGDGADRVGDPGPVRHGELEHVPADPALQLLGRARRDDLAVVDDHDLVGQFVGLVQVLGGEQQRGAAGHQRPDDVPHPQPGPRVQARGRLVEEQHLRAARPGWRPGPGAAACRRSRSWPRRSAASIRSNCSSSSAARLRASGQLRWYSRPMISRFSRPVSSSWIAADCPASPIDRRTAAASRTTS